VGQARDRRLGQAGALGDLLVAQAYVAGLEGAQHLQPARQRGDELPVPGVALDREVDVEGRIEAPPAAHALLPVARRAVPLPLVRESVIA